MRCSRRETSASKLWVVTASVVGEGASAVNVLPRYEDRDMSGAAREKGAAGADIVAFARGFKTMPRPRHTASVRRPPDQTRLTRISRPFIGPLDERRQQFQKLKAPRAEAIPAGVAENKPARAQFLEAGVEQRGIGLGCALERPECESVIGARQLPQNAQGGPAAKQIEQRHHRAAGARAAHGNARPRNR